MRKRCITTIYKKYEEETRKQEDNYTQEYPLPYSKIICIHYCIQTDIIINTLALYIAKK